jgi:hypothetical protein
MSIIGVTLNRSKEMTKEMGKEKSKENTDIH